MSTPSQTMKPWTHRKVGDHWEVYDSNQQWLASFRIEGDCLGFISVAGPKTSVGYTQGDDE